MDLERQRRTLSVRCNMLSRRFALCSQEVKITIFKTYCQTLYTCNLWSNYTKTDYSAMRIQYNNALRGLLGLSRYYSSSGMFDVCLIDGFETVVRKRVASLMARVRGSANSLLRMIALRMDSRILVCTYIGCLFM